ncbi:MAG: response regulator transcription factor [Candidatus Phytoplasma sp.]|nr:response regulator transcription factor [Phytoplasma sp.]
MLVYFLEDDTSIHYIIEKTLQQANFSYEGFYEAEKLIERIKENMPDLFLLDIMLPDLSGIEVIKYIRSKSKDAIIIVVSALNSEIDKVKALDLGADDYITKPFGVLELISRINAHARRIEKTKVYVKEDLKLNLEEHSFYIKDRKVTLTNKEFDVLYLLLKNEGKVVRKETFFKEIWDMTAEVETRTLDMHIKSLREKIKDSKVEIITVRGVGYQI